MDKRQFANPTPSVCSVMVRTLEASPFSVGACDSRHGVSARGRREQDSILLERGQLQKFLKGGIIAIFRMRVGVLVCVSSFFRFFQTCPICNTCLISRSIKVGLDSKRHSTPITVFTLEWLRRIR